MHEHMSALPRRTARQPCTRPEGLVLGGEKWTMLSGTEVPAGDVRRRGAVAGTPTPRSKVTEMGMHAVSALSRNGDV